GVVAPDVVTCSAGSATFADKNAGTGKTVTATGIALGGASAGNYQLSATTATTTADITPKSLTVTGGPANNKQYDGTTAATLNTATAALLGVIAPDIVNLNTTGATGTFNGKNVGTGKIVTLSGLALRGADNGNYTLPTPQQTTPADITAKALAVSFTVSSKEYDGTTAATILTRSVSGKVGSEDVSASGGTATFDTKNVGTGKTVSATGFTLIGADKDNYAIATVNTTTADITAKTLTVSFTVSSKEYDGTTDRE